MRTPHVIAEFAGCHDHDLDKMLRGVAAAAEADADAFKTWWSSDAAKTCERMHAPEMLATYRLGEFPQGWLPIIRDACKARGLEFICTVDLIEDVGVVAPFVDRFKVASWGCTDDEFLGEFYKYDRPVIVSMGASDERALQAEYNWSFLHCVSAYPCPTEEANLAAIRRYQLAGWSDHTKKVLMGALAVAAGATVLEVHFCLPDTAEDNADRCVSHEPLHLAEYVRLARLAAVAMGDGVKRIMPSEERWLRHRYSIP